MVIYMIEGSCLKEFDNDNYYEFEKELAEDYWMFEQGETCSGNRKNW